MTPVGHEIVVNPIYCNSTSSVLSQKYVRSAFALLQDRIGCRHPLKWRGLGVVALHEQFDLLLEFEPAGERIAADRKLGDQRFTWLSQEL